MAHFVNKDEGFPLLEQIKSLGDGELLDFWEESQYLEKFLDDDAEESGAEYERLILQELMLRSCIRPISPR
ncbi:hypothetical protein [Desulfohalovibrio reitneri]|uniref:hypothetical protein n=1 Tax=Desulfohalovibrio reitneri TaxID=1307759 RepID=UPI0004A71526|nr:hypothetical protein [Desulfohalovibrio reitneri]